MEHIIVAGEPGSGRTLIAEALIAALAPARTRIDIDAQNAAHVGQAALEGVELLVLDDSLSRVVKGWKANLEGFIRSGGMMVAQVVPARLDEEETGEFLTWLSQNSAFRLIEITKDRDIPYAEPVALPVGHAAAAHLVASQIPGNVVHAARHILSDLSRQGLTSTAPIEEKVQFSHMLGAIDAALDLAAKAYPMKGTRGRRRREDRASSLSA